MDIQWKNQLTAFLRITYLIHYDNAKAHILMSIPEDRHESDQRQINK